MISRFEAEAIVAARGGERVLYLAPLSVESTEHFRQVVNELEGNTDVRKVTFSNGNQRVQFFSGGEIAFTAVDRRGGRGYAPDVMILDEVSPMTTGVAEVVAKGGRVVH